MTIIFENGDEFWIDAIETTVQFNASNDVGADDDTAVSLSRPGFFLAGTISMKRSAPGESNTTETAFAQLQNGAGNELSMGDFISQVTPQITKAGGSGNTTYLFRILLFMRGRKLLT